MIEILEIELDPKARGVDASQVNLDKNLTYGFDSIMDFLLFENDHYGNTGEPIPGKVKLVFKLKKKAKLTDFLLSGGLRPQFGLLVSDKVFKFLKKLRLSPYTSYPARLTGGENEIVTHYWIYFHRFGDGVIDFSKTSRLLGSSSYYYNSDKEFIAFRKAATNQIYKLDKNMAILPVDKFKRIKELREASAPSKWYIKPSFKKEDYDLYCFKYDSNYYVSEHLKSALKNTDFTGYAIKSIDSRLIFSGS